jgi:hypothetical protein
MEDLQYTTTVQFVELYLNGQYDGVYLLCEQTEVGSTRVDISDDLDNTDTGYLIELDARAPDEGTLDREYFTIDGTHYAVKSPDPEEDDYTTHSGCALLLQLSLETEVAYILAYLLASQKADDDLAEEDGDKQREHDGCHCAKRDISTDTHSWKVGILV